MNKADFLSYLRKELKLFPQGEIEDAINYYDELLTDKIEKDGMDEISAVTSLGDPASVAKLCASEMIIDNKQKSPLKAIWTVMRSYDTPVLIPVAILVAILYVTVVVIWAGLVLGFAAGSVGGLFVIVGALLSQEFVYTLTAGGIGLAAFALCFIICYYLVLAGRKSVNGLTVLLAKGISRKNRN